MRVSSSAGSLFIAIMEHYTSFWWDTRMDSIRV